MTVWWGGCWLFVKFHATVFFYLTALTVKSNGSLEPAEIVNHLYGKDNMETESLPQQEHTLNLEMEDSVVDNTNRYNNFIHIIFVRKLV